MKPVNGVNQASVVDLGAYSRDQEHGKSGEDITYINYINQDKARTYKPKIHKTGILKTFYCLRYPACDLLGSRAVESYKKKNIDVSYTLKLRATETCSNSTSVCILRICPGACFFGRQVIREVANGTDIGCI